MQHQHREFALNQWWETLSTVAKALFFFIVTPVLLQRLGPVNYGFLALAISVMNCVLAFDFGIRMRLRVALSELSSSEAAALGSRGLAQALGHGLGLFALLVLLALPVTGGGIWQKWTGSDASLLAVALAGTGALGVSFTLLEPLAAHQRLSLVRAAGFFGNVLSILVVLWLVYRGAGAHGCFLGYALSLTAGNLACAAFYPSQEIRGLRHSLPMLSPAGLFGSIYAGRWFGLATAETLLKSYLLTFLTGAMLGPAAAGTYFILLKLSELVSVFGANVSDTATADLAALPKASARAANLRASYSYTLAMCLVAFAGLACLGPLVLGRILRLPLHDPSLAITVGTFGLAVAFNRILLTACMGISLTHLAAVWGLAEVVVLLGGAALLVPHLGVAGIFAAGSIAWLALIPVARGVASNVGQGLWRTWIQPALALIPFFLIAAGCAWLGGYFRSDLPPILGFLIAIGAAAFRLKSAHSARPGAHEIGA